MRFTHGYGHTPITPLQLLADIADLGYFSYATNFQECVSGTPSILALSKRLQPFYESHLCSPSKPYARATHFTD
jgi:hypothetical protein